jgi:hypothetical protein
MALPVNVMADTGRGERLAVRPPPAKVWLARVAPSKAAGVPSTTPTASAPLASQVALPEPAPEAPEGELPAPPALEIDPGLKPPLLRTPATLEVPAGARRGFVELDVQVDEGGRVSGVRWVGGSVDSAQVGAATRCALAMLFYPARRGGRPVSVWCRQRFDFRGGR